MCYSLQLVLLFIFGLYFVYHILFSIGSMKKASQKKEAITWDDCTAPMIMSLKSGFFFSLSFAEEDVAFFVAASVFFLVAPVNQHAVSTYCAQ